MLEYQHRQAISEGENMAFITALSTAIGLLLGFSLQRFVAIYLDMNSLIISFEHEKEDQKEKVMQNYKSQKFSFLVFALLILILSVAYYIFILTIWHAKDQDIISSLPEKFQSFVYIAFYILLFSLWLISFVVFHALFKNAYYLIENGVKLLSTLARHHLCFAFFFSFLLLCFLIHLSRLVGM
jgi:hypothetical protein